MNKIIIEVHLVVNYEYLNSAWLNSELVLVKD